MNPLIETIGWTLVHFVWQAGIVAALLWVALRYVRPARVRYLCSGGALLAMLACAAATAAHEWRPPAPPGEGRAVPGAAAGPAGPQRGDPVPASAATDLTPDPGGLAAGARGAGALTGVSARSLRESAGEGVRAYLPWLVALWAAGVVALSARFLRSWQALRRLRSGASPLEDGGAGVIFERLLDKMGLRGPVALLSTAEAVVPMAVGWLRPAVIVPAALVARLPTWQVEAILAHELAHVRRRDYLVNVMQNVVETVFFYHPAVWWVSGRLREEREHCCDDVAAAICGGALDYARALTALEEMRGYGMPAGAPSAAGGSLVGRVRRLLGAPAGDPGTAPFVPAAVVVALLLAGLFPGGHLVQGAPEEVGDAVRGVNLGGVPTVDDVTRIAELYEADPESPGDFRKKEGVFFMSLGRVGPWLYYPSGADHFYIEVRPDPEVVKDIVYGPIGGNPVERLDLAGWLRGSPGHPDPGYARRVARNMIGCGDASLARLALGWLGEFAPPSPPEAHGSLIAAIENHLKMAPRSAVAEEARATLVKLRALTEQSRVAWEAARPRLPDEEYQGGEATGGAPADVVWSAPTANGLRLGVAGVVPGESWRFGEAKAISVFVRNDGAAPVKFAWTPRTDEGLSAALVGPDGVERSASIARFSTLLFHQRCRLDPGHLLKLKPGAEFTLVRADKDGKVPAERRALNYFAVPGPTPGATGRAPHPTVFELRFGAHLGVEDWTDSRGTPHPRPAGEWAGRLEAKPIPIKVVEPVPEHAEVAPPATRGRRGRDAGRSGGVRPGEVWPAEKLAALPFGPAAANGLRVARFLSPIQESYEIGSKVDARIVYHNSGTEAVEFTTEDWHQNDTWHCRDAAGKEVSPWVARRMGFRGYPVFRLEPGQVCEVAAQGTAIGTVPYDDEPGAVYCTVKLPVEPGDVLTCWWDVTLQPGGKKKVETLRSGEFTFKVTPRPADFPVDLGIARTLGKYHLAEGVMLQLSRGRKTTATIEWADGRRHTIDLPQRDRSDPVGLITWWRGGDAFWIAGDDKLTQVDFAPAAAVKVESWAWKDAPEDFGGAPQKVQAEIRKYQPAAPQAATSEPERSFFGRPLGKWDEMLGSGGIRSSDREALKGIGYGKADVPIPDAAVPLLLALVESGQSATKCRCLGTLRKLENPSNEVLDTVIRALGDAKSRGNRFRAGYFLGDYKGRSEYIVSRVIPLLSREGSVDQEAAAFALGKVGPAAADALPVLEAVRPTASEALKKVIDKAIASIRDEAPQAGADAAAAAPADGIVILAVDADTGVPLERFEVIAGVPSSVSRGFEEAKGVAVVNWQPHTIRPGKDGEFTWPAGRGYAEMSLRVEAEGYVPQVIHGLSKGAREVFSLELKRDPGVEGSVTTPGGGRAAHDATVVLAMIRRNARLNGTTFPELVLRDGNSPRDRWVRPAVVRPDRRGRFRLPDEPDPTAVVLVLHGDGVFVQPFAGWKKAPHVMLQPWGRIHGRVRWGERMGSGEKVDLSINRGDAYGYPDIVAQYDDTRADEEGRFVFERVLPGMVQLSCPIDFTGPDGERSSTYLEGRITHADVQAPHTSVVVGGRGRTVTGRLSGPAKPGGVTFRLHPNAPHFGRRGDGRQWAAFSAFKESPSGSTFFRDGLEVAADGTFEIPGLLPGYYQIFFRREGVRGYAATGSFRVSNESWEGDPEPFDIGEFKAR